MMQQIDLMLRQVCIGNAKAAKGSKSRIDPVYRARLRGERFDQFTTAVDEWSRFGSEFTGSQQRGDLPDLGNGKFVSVQCDHHVTNGAAFYNKLLEQASAALFAGVRLSS